MKVKVWLDSGANIHSKKESIIELNFTKEDWLKIPEQERDEIMQEIAFSSLDWGYNIIAD